MYNGAAKRVRFMKRLKMTFVRSTLFNARKLELRVATEESF
jgi:hypothetical protein